jgi:hypothetical protein
MTSPLPDYALFFMLWCQARACSSAEPYHRAILSPINSTPISPDASASGAFPVQSQSSAKAPILELQGSSDRRPTRLVLLARLGQCADASIALPALRRPRVLRVGGSAATGVLRGLPGPLFTTGSGIATAGAAVGTGSAAARSEVLAFWARRRTMASLLISTSRRSPLERPNFFSAAAGRVTQPS